MTVVLYLDVFVLLMVGSSSRTNTTHLQLGLNIQMLICLGVSPKLFRYYIKVQCSFNCRYEWPSVTISTALATPQYSPKHRVWTEPLSAMLAFTPEADGTGCTAPYFGDGLIGRH